MEEDFVYWRHRLPIGIKVEEISGGARYGSPTVWLEMARQIYCENGRDGYREVGHYESGAPYLSGEQSRISVTHTAGLLAVATLPRTPEVDLRTFVPRAAMGIDTERRDRSQVLAVRERFLNDAELLLAEPDDVTANITLWTAKEAVYKAALTPGLDIRQEIRIKELPEPMTVEKGPDGHPVFNYKEGRATVRIADKIYEMNLFCYDSDDCRITLAYSPKCAKFIKN